MSLFYCEYLDLRHIDRTYHDSQMLKYVYKSVLKQFQSYIQDAKGILTAKLYL